MSSRPVIAVRDDVARSELIDGLVDEVARRMAGGPPLRSAAALAAVPGIERTGVAARLALAGHVTRQVERATFSIARDYSAVVEERLRDSAGPWPAPAVAVASDLSALEPAGRPPPDDGGTTTWIVPGPGGHVRHIIAMRFATLEAAGRLPAELADPAALKRCWVYGFYVACCEECPSAGDLT